MAYRVRVKPGIVRADVLAAIAFYQRRGWDWTSVVAYLAQRAMWRRKGGQ